MILAGFLLHLSLSVFIETRFPEFGWKYSGFCAPYGLFVPPLLLIAISGGVVLVTSLKEGKIALELGVTTFVASFVLNLAGDHLGLMTVFCSSSAINASEHNGNYWDVVDDLFPGVWTVYSSCSLAVVVIASIALFRHYLTKITPQATKLPHPEVVLLGVCLHLTVWYIIVLSGDDFYFLLCGTGGTGLWLLLLALSALLTGLTWIRSTKNFRALRSFNTFAGTFLLQMISGHTHGDRAFVCAQDNGDDAYNCRYSSFRYAGFILNATIAVAMTIRFLKTNQPSNPEIDGENGTVDTHPNDLSARANTGPVQIAECLVLNPEPPHSSRTDPKTGPEVEPLEAE